MRDALLDDLNQAQKEAVTHGDGPLLIVAGAGTGKTTVITRRIAWLIREGRAKGDEILGLTFTDKAAGEMEERVDRLLPMGYLDLWLSTFHAFGERLLKDHAIDIGLPNDFKLLDQTAQWMLVRRHLDRFDLDYYRPLGNPTKFIHALLKHFSRAKDEGVSADEYLNYVEELKLNSGAGESTGGSIVPARKSKMTRSVTLSQVEGSPTNVGSHTRGIPRQVQDDGNADELDIARLEEIAKAYKVYEQLLLEEDALDFGDLILYTLRLLQARPQILALYRTQFKYILVDEFQDTNWAQYELVKLLATHPHLESSPLLGGGTMTKTSPLERGETKRGVSTVGANLTVVGDDDQSIYKFRGASVSNILQFQKDYPDAKAVTLTTNYRSRQHILDVSYEFIQQNNPNRLEVQARGGKTISKKLAAARGAGGECAPLKYHDSYEESAGVVAKIMELNAGGAQRDGWNDFAILVRANSQTDMFVAALEAAGVPYVHLTPKGLFVAPLIADLIAFLKLLDNYHESAALWRVLNWPVFDFSGPVLIELNALAQRKAWSLYQALEAAERDAAFDEATRKEIGRVRGLIHELTGFAKEKRPREVIVTLLQKSGYLHWLETQKEPLPTQQNAMLTQFDRMIREFEAEQREARVQGLLQYIELARDAGDTGDLALDPSQGPEAVKVMTVHAAKGLEFRHVFVVNMVNKRFPSIGRREPIELPLGLVKEIIPEGDIHLEEERRLLYVAMTRAQDGLYFTRADDYGGKTMKKPSRFLLELGLVDKEADAPAPRATHRFASVSAQALPRKSFPPHTPDAFSFTQLKDFENCLAQYHARYVLKLPQPGTAALSFGNTVHLALQRFFKQVIAQRGARQEGLFETREQETARKDSVQLPPLDTLLALYRENWIDDWFGSAKEKEQYRREGEEALTQYYALLQKDPPRVEHVEKSFKMKLEGGYLLKGMIDRIDRLPSGLLALIDYKTGFFKKTGDARRYLEYQLLIYQLAAEEVLKEKVGTLQDWFVQEQYAHELLGDEKKLAEARVWALKTIENIRAVGDWEAALAAHARTDCMYCKNRKW